MDRILLKGLEVFAYHGVNPEEKREGQRFVADVSLAADLSRARRSDRLEDTINYAAVRKAVQGALTGASYDLLERAAQAVCDRLLAEFPQARAVTLRLKKPDAPMDAVFEYAAVEITQEREG